jgi:hypothetical protein
LIFIKKAIYFLHKKTDMVKPMMPPNPLMINIFSFILSRVNELPGDASEEISIPANSSFTGMCVPFFEAKRKYPKINPNPMNNIVIADIRNLLFIIIFLLHSFF